MRSFFGQFVEFVVVGGEQRFGAGALVVVQVFGEAPGDADAVVGAGAAPDFVEQDERAVADIVHNQRGFVHFHHKRTFAAADVVAGAHAGEHLVYQADAGAFGGHETAHLGHQRDEGRLAQQGRFAGHIGAGDQDDLYFVVVEVDVVGHVRFADGQLGFDDRVPAVADVEHGGIVQFRAVVVVFQGHFGKRQQAVQPGDQLGIVLYRLDVLADFLRQGEKDMFFQFQHFFFGAEDFGFQYLSVPR